MGKKKNPKKNKMSAEETIFSYIIRDYNSCGSLGSAEGQIMPVDLSSSILYESFFKKCLWKSCDLTNVSGNGCRFAMCDFEGCKVITAAFQHSVFDCNVYYNNIFSGSNFAYSIFDWNALKKTDIDGCAFTGAAFNNTTFQNCTIKHSNFELCVFQNTSFIDTDLSNLTLKYVFFKNVRMENVKLPFMQIPYTFGGMRFVLSQKDNVSLVTTNPDRPLMKVKEYKKLLPELIEFFENKNDYFPLANCYLANDQLESAKKANMEGIITSILNCDFRKLYFFCIQASQEIKLSKEERRGIYKKISDAMRSETLSEAESREFRHYFPMIKRLMFDNPYNNPALSVSLQTNIAAYDFKNLGLLMKALDTIAENSGAELDSKHLEIRHNSPNIVDWFPVGKLPELLSLLENMIGFIKPFLSDAAEAVPVILGGAADLAALASFFKEEKKETENKNKTGSNDKNIKYDAIGNSENPAAGVCDETRKMRDELESRKIKYQKENVLKFDLNPTGTKENDRAVSDIAEEMEKANIKIENIEIHLLNEQSDPLECFYNNGNII